MQRKQLVALFTCVFISAINGSTTLALLPVYMQQLGANESSTGVYFGLAFSALALGAMVSGWLSDRFQRRKLSLLLAGAVAMPTTFLMGQVDNLMILTMLTMVVWFIGSFTGTTISIIAGIYANPAARGLIFGAIAAAPGLSRIVSGSTSGAIVDRWGFSVLFMVLAVVWVGQVIVSFVIEDKRIVLPSDEQSVPSSTVPMGRVIWFLIVAYFLIYVTNFSGNLGQPLAMNALEFDTSSISSLVAITGLVALPLPFLIGWLSDRLGRRPLLILICAVVSLGAFTLSFASELWQFWLSAALLGFSSSARSVGQAYVTDLVPPRILSIAISRLSAASPLGGIVGFGLTGVVIQGVGVQTAFLMIAMLPLAGIALLLAIKHPVHKVQEAIAP